MTVTDDKNFRKEKKKEKTNITTFKKAPR